MTPSFTISLDFELRWGIRDNTNASGYENAILGGRAAIPRMLDLFEEFDVAATWATVGFLFAENKEELLAHLPAQRPNYRDPKLSPYEDVETRIGRDEAEDPLHFGLSLIRRIQDCPRQEIGSHTFSHFYCLEDGGTPEDFEAEMHSADAIAKTKGIDLKSLVLSRNQVSVPHLKAARAAGISVYRSNPRSHLYAARSRDQEKLALRAMRLADSILPLASTAAEPSFDESCGLFDAPGSRFLRPIKAQSSVMAKAQLRRIKGEMTSAAKSGKNYHLWWHPHNFGRSTDANLDHLRSALVHFRTLRDHYGMQPQNMFELSQ